MTQAVFYYDFSSPFAYLAAMRIDDLLPGVLWRPFAFGILLREHRRIPWSLGDGREAGMAEVQQRAAQRGLPPIRWADGWPGETYSLAPLRAAMLAEERGALKDFTRAAYRIHFAEGSGLDEADVVRAGEEAGMD